MRKSSSRKPRANPLPVLEPEPYQEQHRLPGGGAAAGPVRGAGYHLWDWAVLCAVLTAATLLSLFKIRDPDFFWHLKIGQLILERGQLIHTNTLSSLFAANAWHNPEWLFEVLLAQAHAWGGWIGIATLKTLLSAAFAGLVFSAARRQGADRLTAFGLTLVVIAATRYRLTERPHLVSYFLFALTVFLAEMFRRGRRRAVACAIPALFVLWGNVHPGLIFGLLHLFVLALGELTIGGKSSDGGTGRGGQLLGLALSATVAALVNPEGYRVLTYGWQHRHLHEVLDIREFTAAPLAAHLPFYGLAALLLICLVLSRRRLDLPLSASAILFFVLGALYRRNIPEFAVVGSLCLAGLIAAAPAGRTRVITIAVNSLAVAATLWCLMWDRNYPYRFGIGPLEDTLPSGAADVLAREALPRNLYNGFGIGGYLAYRLFPRYAVFQDGRIPAYPLDFLAAVHLRNYGPEWLELLRRYDVNTAVIEIPLLEYGFTEKDWAVVYWDDLFAVVVRRAAVAQGFLERLEYRFFRPYAPPPRALSPAAYRRTQEEIARNGRERQRVVSGAAVKSISP